MRLIQVCSFFIVDEIFRWNLTLCRSFSKIKFSKCSCQAPLMFLYTLQIKINYQIKLTHSRKEKKNIWNWQKDVWKAQNHVETINIKEHWLLFVKKDIVPHSLGHLHLFCCRMSVAHLLLGISTWVDRDREDQFNLLGKQIGSTNITCKLILRSGQEPL